MATGPSPPRSGQAARAWLGSPPGAHGVTAVRPGGAGTKSLLGRGLPADPEPVLCGHLGAAARVGRRARAGHGGGRAAAGPEGNTGEARGGRAESPPPPPLPTRPLPITLPVGFLSLPPPPTGSRAGAAQRKSISRRQLRPALAKQPPGRDGERPRLRITDEVVSSSWRFYSSRPSQSASAPPPGQSWPFPHFGDQPIAALGIMGDVVQECGRGGTCF